MKSVYHILYKIPEIDEYYITVEQQELATSIIKEGLLRIDTEYYCNFVHYSDSKDAVNTTFSKTELEEKSLSSYSRTKIKNIYKLKNIAIQESRIDTIITSLKKKLFKLNVPPDDLTHKLALILIQSAHPIIFKWIILDRVDVFITYSSSIGEVMDIQSWKYSGSNSGMQSIHSNFIKIYISCGGDPFKENNKNTPVYGDGWAALARLQIISAQEIGHFADIMREKATGKKISRYSTTSLQCIAPNPVIGKGRKNDIQICNKFIEGLKKIGLGKLMDIEKKILFYEKNKMTTLYKVVLLCLKQLYLYKISRFGNKNNIVFLKVFLKEKYVSLTLNMMYEDMLANLEPIANVYKRDNQTEQEAIACAEALARVPQQVMKWGHLTTKYMMKNLYKSYYYKIVPDLISTYNNILNVKYKRNLKLYRNNIFYKIKRLFHKNKASDFVKVKNII